MLRAQFGGKRLDEGVASIALFRRDVRGRRVVHKESVQLCCNKLTAFRLGKCQAREFIAGPVALFPKDGLCAAVVVAFAEFKLIVHKRVASQRTCASLDVCFGVAAAFAENE